MMIPLLLLLLMIVALMVVGDGRWDTGSAHCTCDVCCAFNLHFVITRTRFESTRLGEGIIYCFKFATHPLPPPFTQIKTYVFMCTLP